MSIGAGLAILDIWIAVGYIGSRKNADPPATVFVAICAAIATGLVTGSC